MCKEEDGVSRVSHANYLALTRPVAPAGRSYSRPAWLALTMLLRVALGGVRLVWACFASYTFPRPQSSHRPPPSTRVGEARWDFLVGPNFAR